VKRRRILAATAGLALCLTVGLPAASADMPSTPYEAGRTWGCIDQRYLRVGVCIGNPIPWVVPGVTR
jgi:hypothetical protein